MKKTALFSALFTFTLSVPLYALGLGAMKVESALDQPFVAEIELLDAHNIALDRIKVGVAEPKDYQSLGIDRSEIVGSLFFKIKKSKNGKYVIDVRSLNRITEPYMQLVVDLMWAKGQIYKVYTVLLDPPGYKLVNTIAQSGLTYQRKLSDYHPKSAILTKGHDLVDGEKSKKNRIYGPTTSNENIWQIAQRYKTVEAILPQIVLAIVGENPDAFVDGNLNGLKAEISLKIPINQNFLDVPAELATVEVMAHDKAWNEKSQINHVLSPPYTISQTFNAYPVVEYSQIPPVPKFADTIIPSFNQSTLLPSLKQQKQMRTEQGRTLKAEISITTAAVDSLRESNALLIEQLNFLQTQNKKLQKQLEVRDKELHVVRNQLHIMMKERIATAGQTSSSNDTSSNFWLLFILLFAAVGSGGIAFYYFKRREQKENRVQKPTQTKSQSTSSQPTMSQIEVPINQEPLVETKSESVLKLPPDSEKEETSFSNESSNEHDEKISKVIPDKDLKNQMDKSDQELDDELHDGNLLEFES
ncbi:MAG: fimbrial protein FimV, partial [Legionella longbeachae]|nr:fimbrial protein FimV [Legionella longbeachae]